MRNYVFLLNWDGRWGLLDYCNLPKKKQKLARLCKTVDCSAFKVTNRTLNQSPSNLLLNVSLLEVSMPGSVCCHWIQWNWLKVATGLVFNQSALPCFHGGNQYTRETHNMNNSHLLSPRAILAWRSQHPSQQHPLFAWAINLMRLVQALCVNQAPYELSFHLAHWCFF